LFLIRKLIRIFSAFPWILNISSILPVKINNWKKTTKQPPNIPPMTPFAFVCLCLTSSYSFLPTQKEVLYFEKEMPGFINAIKQKSAQIRVAHPDSKIKGIKPANASG
jgi:uncharacterized membrane protein YadS